MFQGFSRSKNPDDASVAAAVATADDCDRTSDTDCRKQREVGVALVLPQDTLNATTHTSVGVYVVT